MDDNSTNKIEFQVTAKPDKQSFDKAGKELEKSLKNGAQKSIDASNIAKTIKKARKVTANVNQPKAVNNAAKWAADDARRIKENSYKIPKVETPKTDVPKPSEKTASGNFGVKAASAVTKAASLISKATANAAKSVLKFNTNLVKTAASAIIAKTGIAKLVNKIEYFRKAIIRIATYRGIRAVMSYINSSVKDGTSNLYKYSQLINGSFMKSMDNLKTSLTYGTNAIGAFAGNILTALEPALTKIIDKLAEAFNYLSAFVAKLSGSNTYTKATKAVQSYGDSLDSASKSQKDLFGFDELNRLSGENNSSYGSMFETVVFEAEQTGNVIENLAGKINEWVDDFDIDFVAEKIGNTLNDIVNKINSFMDEVRFDAIGSKLAQGFNTLADTIDPNNLGKVLSQKINATIDFLKGFTEKLNWSGMGTWLGNVVGSWLNSIHWDNAEKALSNAINGLVNFCKSFIESMDSSGIIFKVTKFINNLINDIDWANIGALIATFIKNVTENVNALFSKIDWNKVATGIGDLLNNLVENINWKSLGKYISTFIKTLVESVETLFSKIDWVAVGDSIYELLAGIDWKGIFTDLASVVWTAVQAMLQVIGGFATNVTSKQVTNNRTQASKSGTTAQHIDSEPGQGTNKTNNTVFDIDPDAYTQAINATADALNNATKTIVSAKDKLKDSQVADRMASGGVPSVGSLFWAGEAGPELVTQVGSRTTVFNENQLAGMLASSNGAVVSAILSAASELISAVNSKDTEISINGTTLARAVYKPLKRESQLQGVSVLT